MSTDVFVGSCINARRRALGWHETRLAEIVGVETARLRDIEAGLVRPAAQELHQIAQGLGTSMSQMFPRWLS